ncbi:hypothetical protein RQP46_010347 [Phenoliferia psychrophenolica]
MLFEDSRNAAWKTIPNASDHLKWWQDHGRVQLLLYISVIYVGEGLVGFDSTIVGKLQGLSIWKSDLGHPNAAKIGLLNAMGYITSVLFGPVSGYVADRWGRRWPMRFFGYTMIVGTVIGVCAGITGVNSYGLFLASRAVTGIGLAGATQTAMIMCQEISHPRSRALVAGAFDQNWAAGNVIASLCVLGTSFIKSSWSWRIPYLIQLIPSVYLLVALQFIPESPRFLLAHGRDAEAMEFLVKYHGNGNPDDELVRWEFAEAKGTITLELQSSGTKWKDIIAVPSNRHRFGLAALMAFAYRMSGSAIIQFYYTSGIGAGLSLFSWMCQIGGALGVAKTKRRGMLIYTWPILIVMMAGLCASSGVYAASGKHNQGAAYGTIVLIWLYSGLTSYQAPLLYSYPAEIMSYATRSKGMVETQGYSLEQIAIAFEGNDAKVAIAAVLLNTTRTVKLPFADVTGFARTDSAGTDLPQPILAWYSIPYAAPPTGALRFAFPQPPLRSHTALNLTDYGPLCLQEQGANELSEDCLTLSVFAPVGTEPDAKLPVVLWIPGGSFNLGDGRGFNMPSMIAHAPAPFIGVSINYRLGALQCLPSALSNEANTLNLGLADQRASMLWVQKYIALFGGDADQVTIFGESAGAHSVGYHLLHVDPGAPRLFQRVIMDSGAPTSRAFPNYTYPIYETQAKEFLSDVGSASMYNKYNYSLRWPFQPVVDYKYIARAAHKSWQMGAFQKVDILTGFNSDEGSIFAPQNLSTSAEFRDWWKVLVPTLTSDLLDEIEELYPDPSAPGSPYANSTLSPQYTRMVDAYGDYAYISQVQANAIEASSWEVSGGSVYKYHFAQRVGQAQFVTHGSELQYVAVAGLSGADKALGLVMNAYYTSFIVSGNPNTLQPSNATFWPAYRTGSQHQLRFQGMNATVEPDNIRRHATNFWRSIPGVLQH